MVGVVRGTTRRAARSLGSAQSVQLQVADSAEGDITRGHQPRRWTGSWSGSKLVPWHSRSAGNGAHTYGFPLERRSVECKAREYHRQRPADLQPVDTPDVQLAPSLIVRGPRIGASTSPPQTR
jgi:hypothetical protein